MGVVDRIEHLLSTMSLEEKVAQLSAAGRAYEMPDLLDNDGVLNTSYLLSRFPHGIGQLGRPAVGRDPAHAQRVTSDIQSALASETRTGIGALFNEEGVHGLMAPQATVFPSALSLAASWDPAFVERVYTAVAVESRARGSNYVYAPVLDLARDPRWGRVEETFGESPHLVSRMGVAAVFGLQGRSGYQISSDRVLACAKHFVGHGSPQSGTNCAPVHLGPRELRETHLAPFAAVITEARVGAIMAAYHEFDGIPVHSDRHLLTEVLRDELAFDGMVTSDGFGILQLATLHRIASDEVDAARIAFDAGVDCEVPEPRGTTGFVELVNQDVLSLSVVDRAVRRVLTAKDRLGLLDLDRAADPPTFDSEVHDDLAHEAAVRSACLLTNAGVLPLTNPRSIALCGPNALTPHPGGYSDRSATGVSLLEGLQRRFGAGGLVASEGCRITDSPADAASWWHDQIVFSDPQLDDRRIEEAVDAARSADIAIVAIGGNEATHREGWWFDHLGDRSDLAMTGRQDELVERIAATGTPTVAVVGGGGPVDLRRVVAAADAVMWVGYAGQRGGDSIAAVLSGDRDPGGRLPITFPHSTGQLPIYGERPPSAARPYLDNDAKPLFRLGDGMSYTSFSVDVERPLPATIAVGALDAGAGIAIPVTVTNTGERTGIEHVRLTVDDLLASVTRPRDRLVAFHVFELRSSESETVVLSIDKGDLALLGRAMTREVEPGSFRISIHSTNHVATTDIEVTS